MKTDQNESVPEPSLESIEAAAETVRWIRTSDLLLESVDLDVLGGIAVYLRGTSGKRAWISILNGGGRSIVLDADGRVQSRNADELGFTWLKDQLNASSIVQVAPGCQKEDD